MDFASPAMEPYSDNLLMTGAFYIAGFIFGILSIAKPIDDPAYLTQAGLNKCQIIRAALFQFLMALSYTGIAIGLFPVLKLYNEPLALCFLGFKIMAVLFVLIGTFLLLRIGKLSREYLKAAAPDLVFFNRRGALLKRDRDIINHVAMVILMCVGSIMLYLITLQSGLIPFWLSVWGLAGSFLAVFASILVMLRYIAVLNPFYVMLNIPFAVQEVVFALWLIGIGWNQAS